MHRRHLAAVAFAALTLAGCGTEAAASKPTATLSTTAAPTGQAGYLAAVTPSMTDAHAHDTLGLIRDGNDICDVNRTYALHLLQTAGGYNLTEATAIADAAPRYLCGQ